MAVNPVALITRPVPLTWDQADAAAQALGGRLFIDKMPVGQWLENAAETIGDNSFYEGPIWFGILAAPGGWTWVDGAAVQTLKFTAGDPNADGDPANDIEHAVLGGNFLNWGAPSGPVDKFIVEFTNPASINGSNAAETFLGGAEKGQVLRAGGGNDGWYGLGGGTIFLGAGNDHAQFGSGDHVTPWTGGDPPAGTLVYDGDGGDVVIGTGVQVVSAAIDGDADEFIDLARVSYGEDVAGFVAGPAANGVLVEGAMGADHLSGVYAIVGGSGGDAIEGFQRIDGGRGDDVLRAAAYADGGEGNDTLYSSPGLTVELRGGAGDDTLVMAGGGSISGGTGVDRFVFLEGGTAVINDWTPGEVLDLSALTDKSVAELLAQGSIVIRQLGDSFNYTQLTFNPDGAAGPFDRALIQFKGQLATKPILDSIVTGQVEPLRPINLVNAGHGLLFSEAFQAAAAADGRLLIDKFPNGDWIRAIGEAADDARLYEEAHWFGITGAEVGYRWVDGTEVNPFGYKFAPPGDPNADPDPTNDVLHPVLSGGQWRPPTGPVERFAMEYVDTEVIRGTVWDDTFFGGAGKGEDLFGGDGNDQYFGLGGGRIFLERGDDKAVIGEGNTTTLWTTGEPGASTVVYDGDGRDIVEANVAGVVVVAALDRDNDVFMGLERVTYRMHGNALTVREGSAASVSTGVDTLVEVREVVGGSGDDDMSGIARLVGRGGDDVLRPGAVVGGVAQAYAEGGDGDDTLYTSDVARAELRGEAGADTFILGHAASVSGGAGLDKFVFTALAPVTVNDWTVGEYLDLTALFDAPVGDLFADGALKIGASGGYTQLFADLDGGGDEFALLANLKGVIAASTLDDWILA